MEVQHVSKSKEGFADKGYEDFVCSVCLCVPYINLAIETTCCGSFFCFPCLSRCRAMKEVCPNCNGSFNTHLPREVLSSNKFALKKLNGLLVYCESIFQADSAGNIPSGDRCDWQGAWADIATHMARCEHTMAQCTWNHCRVAVPRKHLRAHEASCTFRTVTCEFCSLAMPQHELQVHQQTCPKYPVTCSCDTQMERLAVPPHKMFSCPDTVLWCSYSGCSTQVPRKEFQTHQSTCCYRPEFCQSCFKSIPYNTLAAHTSFDCPSGLVDCTGLCSEKVLRKDLALHLSTCLSSEVACYVFGCTVKVQRKDLESHFSQSKDEHLRILSQQVSSLHGTVQALLAVVNKQDQTIENLTKQQASMEGKLNANRTA